MAEEQAEQMSLIPFPSQSRDVVLQRGRAVVLYNADSRQLTVQQEEGLNTEQTLCPMCRRPLHDAAREAQTPDHDYATESNRRFMDPQYFAMLAASQNPSPATSGLATPSRAIPLALPDRVPSRSTDHRQPSGSAQFPTTEPFIPSSQGISSSARSPGYFKQWFIEVRELGRGGNGVVLLVEHVIDGIQLGQFACKRIPVGDSHERLSKIIIEVRLLQKIPHPNLVAYHWTWLEDFAVSKFGPSIPCLWILQDFCNGGDLQQYIVGPSMSPPTTEDLKARARRKSRTNASPSRGLHESMRLSLDDILSFLKDIVSGLHHLHSKGYIHRDLKPSNCLLQYDGGRTRPRILISDFGEVQLVGDSRRSTGATGTVAYLAPEVLQQSPDGSFRNFTTKSDIFSLGMIVYFMCFKRLPYTNADGISEEDENLQQLKTEIKGWSGFDDGSLPHVELPDMLFRFLKRLLSPNPAERPGTEEILAILKRGVAPDDLATDIDAQSRTTRRQSLVTRPILAPSKSTGTSSELRSRSPRKHDMSESLSSSLVLERPKEANSEQPSRTTSPQRSVRLMLPPPPAPPPTIYNFLIEAAERSLTTFCVRASCFLIKLATFVVFCPHRAINSWALFPLLILAAFDLGSFAFRWRYSLSLLACHFAFIYTMARYAMLCEGRDTAVWEHRIT